jgi:hypothetical protein
MSDVVGRDGPVTADELNGVLNAHAFLGVERPPQLWSMQVELEPFVRLLGEMLSAGLVRNGNDLQSITLNVANVTVEPDPDSRVPSGDFVAVTVRCKGDWSPEASWHLGSQGDRLFVSQDMNAALVQAEAEYAYVRVLGGEKGSLTVFLRARRADPGRDERVE